MSFALALAVSAPSPIVATASAHHWKTYTNERFGTRAEYPAEIFKDPVFSDNGDGGRWSSDIGAKLLIFGSPNSLNQTPASYAEFLKHSDRLRYSRITYRLIKPKSLILSGTARGHIFYERYEFGDPSGAIHAIAIEYPATAQSILGPLIARMSSSLKWIVRAN